MTNKKSMIELRWKWIVKSGVLLEIKLSRIIEKYKNYDLQININKKNTFDNQF